MGNKELTFYDHLEELRGVLLKSLIAWSIASCITYFFIDPILSFLIRPVHYLVFTAPADAFMARIMLALFTGFILGLPYIIYEIWNFVSWGLKVSEKKYVYVFAPVSLLLFLVGCLFSYFIVIPFSIKFLLGFSTESLRPMITIKSYISFLMSMVLAFGVIFELPLVLMFLTKIGVATPAFLIQKRRYAIVIILIVSALITPPDVVTQLILAFPLMILYEVGIIVSKVVEKKK